MATIGPMQPKVKSFLETDPVSAYVKFEVNWVMCFPFNGPKPLISAILIFLPPAESNCFNTAQKQISSEDSPNKSIHQVCDELSD